MTMGGMADRANAAEAGPPMFDELRFGAEVSIAGGDKRESGLLPTASLYLNPFDSAPAPTNWREMMVPRLYLGVTGGSGERAVNQAFTGLAWTAPVTERFFLEAGFGGTLHDGDLQEDGTAGAKLGCHVLFREYIAAGYAIDRHWRLVGAINHASHANLCDGPNDGLTHASLTLGYKF
ncbi:acyloxyacyl hydrolase [Xaviernesmea oryzae]|nr:acyloxyacyl hydrolase [Xaviernesmea oryzae]